MSEREFDDLSVDEQRNEILKAIHNRLSELKTLLEYWVSSSLREGKLRDMMEYQKDYTMIIPVCEETYYDRYAYEDEDEQDMQEGEID